jgi:hypothetical protein
MGSHMGKESKYYLMAPNILEIGSMVRQMVLELKFWLMEQSTMVIGLMENSIKENVLILMERSTMVSGEMESQMDKE